MITEKEALQLLRRYLKNEKTIRHCMGVADVAYELASKIARKNPMLPVDKDKVKIAALLHDIGRCKDGMHEINTIEILQQEGLDDIAEIVMHGSLYEVFLLKVEAAEKYLPRTIENKIVVLADMYYNQNEQRVSLKERLDDIEERYKDDRDFLKAFRLSKVRMKKLENEINNLM